MSDRLNIAEIAKDRKLDADGVFEILLPYQKKWVADTSSMTFYAKCRRSGISWSDGCKRAMIASAQSGNDCYYQAFEKDMTRQYVEDCANWAKAFNLAASRIYEDEIVFQGNNEKKSITTFKIVFNSGHKIESMVSNPRAIRSKQGDIILDECAFMDDFKGCLKSARAMRIWLNKISMISTFNGIDEPFYQKYQDIKKGREDWSLHFIDFNDCVEQGLYKQICLVKGLEWSQKAQDDWYNEVVKDSGEDADEELFCIPNESGGSYFPRILVERCMDDTIPVFNLSLKDDFVSTSADARYSHVRDWIEESGLAPKLSILQPNLRTSFGFDFGRSGDLSYLIVLQELPNLIRKSAFALELRNVPFTEQEQILFYICDRLPRLIGGALDSRGNGQALAEKAADRYGRWRIEEIPLSQPWYAENMPKYKAALEDRKILLPADSDMVSDHRAIENIRGVPKPTEKKNASTKGLQRHADSAIACALGFYASNFDNESVQPALGSFVFDNYELGSA